MIPSVFRAVMGVRMVNVPSDADGVETFLAREAVLNGYKKISPDNTYLYAVPDPLGRIRGYIVGPMPRRFLSALRKYEGKNYSRRTLGVQTAEGRQKAILFVGNLDQLQHSFGYAFADPLKQMILLQRKIESALLEAQREHLHTSESITSRAMGELHGATIRDLVRRHFDAGGISDYAIRHTLKDTPLADFDQIREEQEAKAIAPNYLELVVRQVIFNELEELIQRDFRYELDRIRTSPSFYERTVSSLASLRILNEVGVLLDLLVADCLSELNFSKDHLVDYVRWAIVAADAIFEPAIVRNHIKLIHDHMGHGYVPLGAELEFSNIGHQVIDDPQGRIVRDTQFDSFLYFSDFGLDVLTWKLGGHVDDHHEKISHRARRGFFELALGNVSIEANLSKPITDDPWLLNQLIQETLRFYRVRPHSLHISLQFRSRRKPNRDRILPLPIMQCLFAIAGDPGIDRDGVFRIGRIHNREICHLESSPGMLFSDVSVRRSRELDDSYPPVRAAGGTGNYVQQFKFLRLTPGLNYEPIILALKGIQISLSPGSFLTPMQHDASRKHRRLFDQLIEWASNPQPIPPSDVDKFLQCVYDGLMVERRGKNAHSEAYIAWGLSQLRQMLEDYNSQAGKAKTRGVAPGTNAPAC